MNAIAPTAAADLAACRQMLAGGSKSFRAASLLLPERVATPATALYAFCRVADDEVDLAEATQAALDRLTRRLDAIYAGRPENHVADRAFAQVVADFAIPRALPDALLDGFAWDAEGRRYATLAELEGYAARVAAAVGAMMTLLMGVRGSAAMARACDLGVAMQLTNIARDVGEDARNGRLYLPLDWMEEEGLDAEAFLAAPRFSPALGRVVQRLLDAADLLYARSELGIPLLPDDCRAGILAARLVYAEIGRALERLGLDSVTRRAYVPNTRKAWLLAQCFVPGLMFPQRYPSPALPATAFLVDAVAATPAPARPLVPRPGLVTRLLSAAEMFQRLTRLERSEGGARRRPHG